MLGSMLHYRNGYKREYIVFQNRLNRFNLAGSLGGFGGHLSRPLDLPDTDGVVMVVLDRQCCACMVA